MNTLNKSITSSFYTSTEAYSELQRRWSTIVNSEEKHNLTAAHYLVYAVLRGKDWRKGFTAPKLEDPSWPSEFPVSVYRALSSVSSIGYGHSPLGSFFRNAFGDLLTADALKSVVALLPSPSADSLQKDAYVVPLTEEVAA